MLRALLFVVLPIGTGSLASCAVVRADPPGTSTPTTGRFVIRDRSADRVVASIPALENRPAIEIRASDVAASLNAMVPAQRSAHATPAALRVEAERLVQLELAAEEARRTGLERDAVVRAAIRQVLADAWLDRELASRVQAARNEDGRAFYDANPARFTRAARVRIQGFAAGTREAAEAAVRALGRARPVPEGRFARIAARFAAYTGKRSALLGWFTESTGDDPTLPRAVANQAFSLIRPGMITSVLDDGEGHFWVLRLMERRDAELASYEDVRSAARSMLMHERETSARTNAIDAARGSRAIVIREDALRTIELQAAAVEERQ